MRRIGFGRIACIVSVFCAAMAIAASAQTFTNLVNFDMTNGGEPASILVQGTDGNFYGTTAVGGVSNTACDSQSCGTLFKMTAAGTLTTLYTFCSQTNCADGSDPGQILLAADGNFYGFTLQGGANCQELAITGCGTIFKITAGGTPTTLYSFCAQTNCTDGWEPDTLVQGVDGNFYGTAATGGANGFGVAFKITSAGVLTILHNFCSSLENGNCADGSLPSALMLATNGKFYGIASEGGTNDCGTVFELTPAGTVTTLVSFNRYGGCGSSGLIQGSDGNFYGTTGLGGVNHQGTVFKMTPAGKLSVLYNFCSQTNCTDGARPSASLVQGNDGNFYGLTRGLGRFNQITDSTVFELTPEGTLTTLHTFDGTDGKQPDALMQATNGTFYGATAFNENEQCDDTGCGTIFSESTGLAPFVEASPNFGAIGRVVNILGNNLTGATSVTFNGTSAKFKVESSTYIKAEVPTGATTGTIEVTTPSGTLNSNVAFQVLP